MTNLLIKPYNPSWINDFNTIKEVLKAQLESLAVEIEHVGSTSVYNLAAKEIIDIDIVYQETPSFHLIKDRLEMIGYYHNGDQGIKGREVFKRSKNQKSHPVLDAIVHHLYACHVENEELQKHLIFRDFLRVHENERMEYESLKYAIALEANQDRKKYAILKENLAREFVERVLKSAIENDR